MLVKFFEGAVNSNQLFECVEMSTPPQVGDFVSFETRGDVARFQVGWVEHIIKTQFIENGDGTVGYEPAPTLIRCGLNSNS